MSSWQVRSRHRPERCTDEDAIVYAVTVGDVSRCYDDQARVGGRGSRWRDLSPARQRRRLDVVERAYGWVDLAKALEDALKEEENAQRGA